MAILAALAPAFGEVLATTYRPTFVGLNNDSVTSAVAAYGWSDLTAHFGEVTREIEGIATWGDTSLAGEESSHDWLNQTTYDAVYRMRAFGFATTGDASSMSATQLRLIIGARDSETAIPSVGGMENVPFAASPSYEGWTPALHAPGELTPANIAAGLADALAELEAVNTEFEADVKETLDLINNSVALGSLGEVASFSVSDLYPPGSEYEEIDTAYVQFASHYYVNRGAALGYTRANLGALVDLDAIFDYDRHLSKINDFFTSLTDLAQNSVLLQLMSEVPTLSWPSLAGETDIEQVLDHAAALLWRSEPSSEWLTDSTFTTNLVITVTDDLTGDDLAVSTAITMIVSMDAKFNSLITDSSLEEKAARWGVTKEAAGWLVKTVVREAFASLGAAIEAIADTSSLEAILYYLEEQDLSSFDVDALDWILLLRDGLRTSAADKRPTVYVGPKGGHLLLGLKELNGATAMDNTGAVDYIRESAADVMETVDSLMVGYIAITPFQASFAHNLYRALGINLIFWQPSDDEIATLNSYRVDKDSVEISATVAKYPEVYNSYTTRVTTNGEGEYELLGAGQGEVYSTSCWAPFSQTTSAAAVFLKENSYVTV